jgi:hypothetical protein
MSKFELITLSISTLVFTEIFSRVYGVFPNGFFRAFLLAIKNSHNQPDDTNMSNQEAFKCPKTNGGGKK